jgi:hypothetical protein
VYLNSKKASIAVNLSQSLSGNSLVSYAHSLVPLATPDKPPPSSQATGRVFVFPPVIGPVLCDISRSTEDRSHAGAYAPAVIGIDTVVGNSASYPTALTLERVCLAGKQSFWGSLSNQGEPIYLPPTLCKIFPISPDGGADAAI